ncbi:hypothetical protein B0O99DRAFT_526677, partial [Bisporella sp. PMI_857]
RPRRTGHPVRSAIHKPQIGRLVVGWVTTSESLLLYVFCFFFPSLFLPGDQHAQSSDGGYQDVRTSKISHRDKLFRGRANLDEDIEIDIL